MGADDVLERDAGHEELVRLGACGGGGQWPPGEYCQPRPFASQQHLRTAVPSYKELQLSQSASYLSLVPV